jgi:hypothetical protein
MQFAYAACHSSYICNLTAIANISQVKNVATVSEDFVSETLCEEKY